MRKLLLIILIGLVTSSFGYAEDYQKEMLKDIVVVQDGKFTANEYALLTLSDGQTTYQIKSYAEAPESGLISRDNFVAFFTVIIKEITESLTNDPNAKTSDLDQIIGNPDVEINCFMNSAGVQVEVKGANGTNRFTQKWSDFFDQ